MDEKNFEFQKKYAQSYSLKILEFRAFPSQVTFCVFFTHSFLENQKLDKKNVQNSLGRINVGIFDKMLNAFYRVT